ncbi:hypothetical protein [Rubellicoccus peritrichatus]|uniref:Uncharacterized protein n=1 Tax=Rubellicoccus peritrichatus TaxID=3080537 RepID=A0AAQ3LCB4_9BACT|nr:hypothetical protein [Puniceicoccus sp. CR14]WOO41245.1 hypothetical protein RZN69_21705 [Puniceicoccus sp. CR14]
MTKIHSTSPLPVAFIYAAAFLISTLQLNALSTDDASYIYFSGSEAEVSDLLGTTNSFTDIVDDIDTTTEDDDGNLSTTLSETSWFAGWEYSTITGLDSSYISYDEDNDEYEVVYFLETSSDDSNIFGSQLQQITSSTTVLEFTEDGEDEADLSIENSTFLNTISDSIICRIYVKGSSASDVSDFSIDFFYPVDATATAYTYTISDGTTNPLSVTEEDLFTEYEEDIIEEIDELEDSDSDGTTSAVLSALEDEAETDGTEALIELILQDKDSYVGDLETVIEALNEIEIDVGDETEDDTTVFDLSLEELNDYGVQTGDVNLPIMYFDFDGLDVTSVDDTTVLSTLFDAVDNNGSTEETVTFTPDDITDDFMESLVDLLNLSIDEDDGGADTEGTYISPLIVDDTYTVTISGEITDPSIVGAAGNYLLASNNSEVIDEDTGWYDTWVGVVNFESTDSDWGYSPVFGSFYAGVANADFDSPWLWADTQVLQQWIHTIESNATDEGFWTYAVDNGEGSVLSGWVFIAVEASEADPENWFIYEFNTDTFHTFSDQ